MDGVKDVRTVSICLLCLILCTYLEQIENELIGKWIKFRLEIAIKIVFVSDVG